MIFKEKKKLSELVEEKGSNSGALVKAESGKTELDRRVSETDSNSVPVAPFKNRLIAAIYDHLILFVVFFIPALVVCNAVVLYVATGVKVAWIDANSIWLAGLILFCYCLSFVGPIFYYTWFESSKLQATPGKLIAGIKVVSKNSGQRVGFFRSLTKSFIQYAILVFILIVASLFTGIFFNHEDIFSLSYKLYTIVVLSLEAVLAAVLLCRPIFDGNRKTLLDKLTGRIVVPKEVSFEVEAEDSANKEKDWKYFLKTAKIIWLMIEVPVVGLLLLTLASDYFLILFPLYLVLFLVFRRKALGLTKKLFYFGTPIVVVAAWSVSFALGSYFHLWYFDYVKPDLALLESGIEAEYKGDVLKAEKLYQKVRDNKKMSWPALVLLQGYSRFFFGPQLDKEEYFVKRSVPLVAANTTMPICKAIALSYIGRYKRAAAVLEKALEIETDPDNRKSLAKELEIMRTCIPQDNHPFLQNKD